MKTTIAALLLLALVATTAVLGANVRSARASVRGAEVGYEALRAEVQFEQADDNDATPVTIKVNVTGLTVGFYGFHIHQLGDISSAFPMNNSITGPHFNPLNQQHGCFPNDTRHVGDIGNLNITSTDSSAWTYLEFQRDLIQLGGDSNQSVIGRALLIHKMQDDCVTADTGNAGTRIGQGVIGINNVTSGSPDTNVAHTNDVARPGQFVGLAVMSPTRNFGMPGMKGIVAFVPIEGSPNMTVLARFEGLPPNTNHSFHVHTFGDLSSPDGMAAGPHYDPTGTAPHDVYPNVPRHMGDAVAYFLADQHGQAEINVERDLLTLTASSGNIVGRGVVLHQTWDQGSILPNGGAGSRLMVGVVGISGRSSLPPPPPSGSSSSSSSGGGMSSSSSSGGSSTGGGNGTDSSSSSSTGDSSTGGVNAASVLAQPLLALMVAAFVALLAL